MRVLLKIIAPILLVFSENQTCAMELKSSCDIEEIKKQKIYENFKNNVRHQIFFAELESDMCYGREGRKMAALTGGEYFSFLKKYMYFKKLNIDQINLLISQYEKEFTQLPDNWKARLCNEHNTNISLKELCKFVVFENPSLLSSLTKVTEDISKELENLVRFFEPTTFQMRGPDSLVF